MNKPACDSPKFDCETAPCEDCPNRPEPSMLRDVLDARSPADLPVLYLSGPMTGREDYNFPAFNAAAARFRTFGFPVLNPADFGCHAEKTWRDCLARDMGALVHADIVVLLDGWDESKGAGLEFDVAIQLGIPAVLAEDVFDKVVLHYIPRDRALAMDELSSHRENLVVLHDPTGRIAVMPREEAMTIVQLDRLETLRKLANTGEPRCSC